MKSAIKPLAKRVLIPLGLTAAASAANAGIYKKILGSLYVKNNDIAYFDSFRVEHIPKETKKFINRPLSSASQNKNIKTNIFRIQVYDSIMCRYFCIEFINFMFKGKTLTEYTNLFSPNDFKRNDDTILNYFMNNTYL